MDIRQKVLEFRSARDKKAFLNHFIAQQKDVEALLQLSFDLAEYPYKEYSSWMLIHLCKSRKVELQSYYSALVDLCFKTDNQTVLRNVMASLAELNVEDHREGEFIDLLIHFIENASNKVALQVYSIYVLIQCAHRHPELVDEFRQIIDFHAQNKTAAYLIASRNFNKSFPC